MRTIFVSLFFFTALHLSAQWACVTQEYIQLLKSSPRVSKNISDAEAFVQARVSKNHAASRLAADFVVHIPVVVHILYSKPSQNISDALVKNQIEILNRDFRRHNSDTTNTPNRFKSLASDVQIEFALATADPKGRATSGIVHVPTTVKYWQMDDQIKFAKNGGDDAWDSHSYLNIWVGDMRSLLGYASVAGGPAENDGVVINFSAFGTTAGTYDMGRTAVHEVGHWLGLKHIWGDTYCGDDNVDDTPKQGNFTSGCPTGIRTTCDNGENGDMYMNYMDFTNDACMNLFTKGQRERMRVQFDDGGPRVSLLNSRGLKEPWAVEEIPASGDTAIASTGLRVYPNPVSSKLVLDFDYDLSWVGKQIRLVNMNGVEVKRIQINSKTITVDFSSLHKGIYFLQGVNSSNGRKINNKVIKF